MKEQNFKNHARLVPEFHILMLSITVTVIILSIINLFYGITLSSVMFFLIGISSGIGFAKIRTGDDVPISVLRDGQSMDITAKAGEGF